MTGRRWGFLAAAMVLVVAAGILLLADGDDGGGAGGAGSGGAGSGGAGGGDAGGGDAGGGDGGGGDAGDRPSQPDVPATGTSTAVAIDAGSDRFEGCLLLADTVEAQRRGLMETTDLGGYDGMLFAFADERPRTFWMRNTPMPLSIAFYDAEGMFVSSADMAPCGDRDDCPLTASDGPAMFAVEVPQGELARLGLVAGSRLTRGGACSP